jgi:hypothetical protein
MRLRLTEEKEIVRYILELDAQGFPPWVADVKAMADCFLAERNQLSIGKNWATTFINRQQELWTKYFRAYNYKRALREDPEVIQGWFCLVENTKAKYGILDKDMYNFDKSGFVMGKISTGLVVTSSERKAQAKRLQQGNWEWVMVTQGITAMGWAIPPFFIFAGRHHLPAWYKKEGLPQDWAIAVSENGWTTNELGVEWLEHFDKHTKG